VLEPREYALSNSALGSRDVELVPIEGVIDHVYVNPTLLPPLLLHDGTFADPCRDRLVFRYIVREAGPPIETTGETPANTVIVFLPCPQPPMKLHMVTVNVYDTPLCNSDAGIAFGTVLTRYTVSMNVWTEELLPLEACTTIDRCAQMRPPLPLDAARSIIGLPHLLTEAGNDTPTVGTNTDDGEVAVTELAEAVGQLRQAEASGDVQAALNGLLVVKVTASPGIMFPSPANRL
jgi:hypothetical protein